MLGKFLFIGGMLSFVLLFILVQTTTPGTIGPLGILAAFVLLYVVVLSVLTFSLYGANHLLHKITAFVGIKWKKTSLSLTHCYYFASVVALGPVMLLAIQSVGELGFYDVLLVGFFVLISCVYVAKRTN